MTVRFWLLLTLLGASVFAQQDMGVITGIVTDASGSSIPGARITVTNSETNEVRIAESAGTGAYTVGPLRIGSYSLSVEKSGFKKSGVTGIQVSAQDRLRADIQLEVGQIADSIVVTAEAALLQSEESSLAHVVEQRQIRDLPLNSRNFQQLAWTSAGVTPSTRGRDRDSGFNSHGQAVTQNNFIVDGIDNNNNIMGMQDRKAQVVIPSLDAVAEFKVQTSNYSAEFGRNSGAVMIVSIKSGTNAFHGSAYEYLRNDFTDARDTFNYGPRNILKQNQFGATLGGPVRRDKTFFFGSWEGFRQRQGQTDLAIVPTADEKNGIFSTRLATILDPVTGQPFSNNTIPRSRFDPTAAKLLDLWPAPNFAGSGTRQNFSANPPWNLNRDQVDARVDHNLSDNDKIFGRVSINRSDGLRSSIFAPPARGGQGNDRAVDKNSAHSAAFSWTRILRPTLINEFRYGFVRQLVDKRELSTESTAELTKRYGITGIPEDSQLRGLPQFTLSGGITYQGLGEPGSMPNFKIHQLHQFLDSLSWNHGNHSFKFGGDLRWNRSDIFGGDAAHGGFTFDGSGTRISFADFLLGLPAQVNLSTPIHGQMRFRNYLLYAQDDWKVTPRLTLNVGIRYELVSPWFDKHNNQSKLDLDPGPNFNKIILAGACGDSWSCRALVETDTNNWAPRLGFAYRLTPRTVIRSGAGIFYGGQGSLGANGRMVSNFPFYRNVTLQSTPTRPAIQLANGLSPTFLGSATVPANNLNWEVWQTRFPTPQVYQWNFTVQRELRSNFTLTTAYVGSSSNYLLGSYNWNGSAPGPPATEQQRRPIPQWNNINVTSPYGHSNYHGLDVQLDRRFAAGFSLTASYTWSHSLDNLPEQFGAGGGGLMDTRNFAGSRGNSNFDTRHRFVSSSVWEVPVGKGRHWLNRGGLLNAIAGGWEITGLLSMQTGHYFTLTVPNARQRLGSTAIASWWPDRIASGSLDHPSAQRWFDTSAFVLPRNADGSWHIGNAGRDILRGDNPFNIDAGLSKSFRITERFALQFRAEAFNVTNTPTLDDPIVNIESPDFGTVRATISNARQLQFALRLSF